MINCKGDIIMIGIENSESHRDSPVLGYVSIYSHNDNKCRISVTAGILLQGTYILGGL